MSGEEGRRRGLGRGLSALFAEERDDAATAGTGRQPLLVPVEQLKPGRFQPRRRFDDEQLRGLANSIAGRGMLQPVLVRPVPPGTKGGALYEIVAGERRWRAAQMAKVHEIPVVVREMTDPEALELGIIENVQRQDLGPLEEAEGYRRLMDEFEFTQENLADRLGRSRSHIANMLRLLTLPASVKAHLDEGRLSAGHARALLGAADPAALAEEVVKRGLSVRATEALAQAAKDGPAKAKPGGGGPAKDADTLALERDLSQILGLKVTIDVAGRGGELTIHYRTLEQLDDVLRRLNQPAR